MLELVGVKLRFDDGRRVALPQRVGLSRGKALAVLGGNGSGKSTLLRVIAGLCKPESGTVAMENGTRAVLVPTNLLSLLFPWYSAATNLALFNSAGRTTRLENEKHFAEKWATLLGRESCAQLLEAPVFKLSSGERSTLALLCILLQPADLFLLDELFSNASNRTARVMTQYLGHQLDQGRSLVFSSHTQELVDLLADEVLDLEELHACS